MENKAEKIRSFLTDKENQELFRLLLNQTKALCRHVFPKRLKGTIHIGFSDPYTTGQAMAAAGLLCPFYKNSIQIIPSFEEEVMEGELMCKGRIRLFNLIIIIGKLFLNKRFCCLLKKVLK